MLWLETLVAFWFVQIIGYRKRRGGAYRRDTLSPRPELVVQSVSNGNLSPGYTSSASQSEHAGTAPRWRPMDVELESHVSSESSTPA